MIELLAPAGNMEALRAAVESGADAVYLSGKMFGARAYAGNFDKKELKEAVKFAHLRNVKIHVTVNTLVDNAEIPELVDYLRCLYEAGADAVLVQDLGAARIAHEVVPDLPLHASTQMTVNNLAGVLSLQELGFSRVVLAREVTLKDIRHICRSCNVEIEVFAHGALCICYSGQCLMSSMIGGRSGNRGRCAQPCRLPYSLVDKSGQNILKDAGQYLLSPRDMNTIDLIPDLIEAGVSSLKLEGRMKKPEYVAVVVNSYRQKIDAYYHKTDLTEDVKKNLAQIFNRDFTTAYLEKRQGRFMMSDKRPNNRGRLIGRVVRYDDKMNYAVIKLTEKVSVGDTIDFWVKVGGRISTNVSAIFVKNKKTAEAAAGMEAIIPVPGRVHTHDRVFKVFDIKLMQNAKSFFSSNTPVRRISLDIKATAKLGEPFRLEAVDDDGFSSNVVSDFIVENALKRATDAQAVEKQMNRLGATIYELRRLDCVIDDNVIVPMSVMNDTRRILVERLINLRLKKYDRPQSVIIDDNKWQRFFEQNKKTAIRPQLVIAADTIPKVQAAVKNGADIVLFGGDSYQHEFITADMYRQTVQICIKSGCKAAFATPRIIRDSEQTAFFKWLENIQDLPIEAIYAHSLAQMYLIHKKGNTPIWADYSFNTYNNATVSFLADYNIQGATVSPELNFKQIKALARSSELPLECIVHGNMELMISEYCVIGSFLGNLDKGSCTKPCEKNKYWLCDRKNEKFPIVTDQFCHMHILNAKELNMLAHLPEFEPSGINRVRIDGRYMNDKELGKITKLYKEVLIEGKNHVALMPENIAKYETNITRGHYFRGVE